jgi:UDP-N-acetylmuramoylalanine--D-glutamate ligase
MKKVAVIGAGISGRAAARFLAGRGVEVFVSEQGLIPAKTKEEFDALCVPYEEGGHTDRALDADLIVLSPGVPLNVPIVTKAKRRKIPIIGEIELAYRFCKSKRIIAVTGTNGKTTTVHFINALLAEYDRTVAGNIGTPFIEQIDKIDEDTIVILEVSSFQLETIDSFRPYISVFLNFSPDHLDWHGTIEKYFAAKCRIFENQTKDDFAVVNENLPLFSLHIKPHLFTFNSLIDEVKKTTRSLSRQNLENLAAALAACRRIDPSIDPSIDIEVISLPHRLEFVAEVGGVRFYNDSKATNVGATLAATHCFDEPLTLLLGGRDKGGDYTPLIKLLVERNKDFCLLIGEAKEKIAKELQRAGLKYRFIRDLREGVELALELGNTCLLSPACASFDMFSSYSERGDVFKKEVLRLARAASVNMAR